MRSGEDVALVLSLVERGLNDCEIARQTGIPRGTVRDWRRCKLPGIWRRIQEAGPKAWCRRCGHPAHDFDSLPGPEYAYLLGMYLGDGTLSRHRRDCYRLRIFLDARYPGIIEETAMAMETVMPTNKVGRQLPLWKGKPSLYEVNCFSKQWPCLFPQHGPGMKHTRPIFLADWQEAICMKHTEPFLRGLIHSDGCRGTNTVKSRHGKSYSYPRYQFSNASCDIRDIFYAACRHIGVEARKMNARNISIAKREHVARLDEFIGPKT
jgi:Homeodomain-like domain